MIAKTFWYFQIPLVTSTSVVIAASSTDLFPMKNVILFFEEYNERPIKRNAKRKEKEFRRDNDEVKWPYIIIEKGIVQISEEDFKFFSEDRELYFVID